MAKRKIGKRKSVSKTPAEPEETGKAAFQLRLKRETHENFSNAAGKLGISLNMLLEGILDACCKGMNHGDAATDSDGRVKTTPEAGMLWFGNWPEMGFSNQGAAERHECWERGNGDPDQEPPGPDVVERRGSVWFRLKFGGSPILRGD